ncbi:MAG: hypothetical protein JWO95_3107 [Verrucomicrobiales bacterium]|nr:hypothetical protein [Verrucomicrobiales bacterium]
MAALRDYVKFEGVNCTLEIRRPGLGTVVAVFRGHDVGEFRDAPFRELAHDLQNHSPINLFVDGRETLAASLDVSSDWAKWMRDNRQHIRRLDILVGSRFLQFTAEFVRKFSGFEDRMRVYTDPTAFDAELATSIRTR